MPGAVRSVDPFAGPPRINGARRVGVRPGTEVVHPLAATGARPLHVEVAGLPPGVTVDDAGILRGTVPHTAGEWPVEVTVRNDAGTATGRVDLVVGDTLALTPPMGWNSWNVFRTEVSAAVIVAVAESLVASGMRDLGYQYVNIDDHWHAARRGPGGQPEPDPEKFPDGIEAVAARLHELGLKLGIYSDAAHLTCGNCFGGYGYERVDAQAYARWGVDLLKYDYCHAPWSGAAARERYGTMGRELAASGRSIVFSVCEWGWRKPWRWARSVGGSYWRTTGDIFDTFDAPVFGVRWIAERNLRLHAFAGPGGWNDPDMLLIGNRGRGRSTGVLQPVEGSRFARPLWRFGGLDDDEAVTHMTLWSMMAAPLLASHDPATISDADLDLLRNPDVLAVDQDPLGRQAHPVDGPAGLWTLVKPLAGGGAAVSVTNPRGGRRRVELPWASLGSGPVPVRLRDVWTGEELVEPEVLRLDLSRHASAMFVTVA